MALPGTLYRFEIDVSDTDRGVYEVVELRVVQHPSESVPYLLTRLVAYALNLQEGLAMSKEGLCQVEDPALFVDDLTGQRQIWIEVGCPSAERLHKASKAAGAVRVYVHKAVEPWLRQVVGKTIHRRQEVEAFALPPEGLEALGQSLKRNNQWVLVHTEGQLYITANDETFELEVTRHSLEPS